MQNRSSFLVAVPFYNEEANVQSSITQINEVLNSVPNSSDVLAINDGSRDNTLLFLDQLLLEKPRLKIIDHGTNKGYGAAIKSAYQYAINNNYDYILFIDGDLTQDPIYIKSFLPFMDQGIDVIKASRYIAGSKVIGVSQFRRNISIVGNLFARLAFHIPITDYTNGFRAIKVSVAKNINLSSNSFDLLMEEIWQLKKYAKSYAEIPYSLTTRSNESSSKFLYSFSTYKNYLKYCYYSIINKKN